MSKSKEDVPRYRMPKIAIGDEVVYYPQAQIGIDPRPAKVVAVAAETVSIAAFEKDAYGVEPCDGVRHVSDPQLSIPEARSSGSWSYSPATLRLMRLEEALASLIADDHSGSQTKLD